MNYQIKEDRKVGTTKHGRKVFVYLSKKEYGEKFNLSGQALKRAHYHYRKEFSDKIKEEFLDSAIINRLSKADSGSFMASGISKERYEELKPAAPRKNKKTEKEAEIIQFKEENQKLKALVLAMAKGEVKGGEIAELVAAM